MMHDAIADRPADMLIGMHMCRGNFKSTWVAEGAYDPAADAVFNQTDVDIYFMEYDTDRAGGLEPLRLLPKGNKRVLPGFITTKTAELEDIDDLRRKFEAASKIRQTSTSSASRRNAASPPPRRAMPSPWTTSVASSTWW
jgi:5-methyltetrahydropteroyltriglutamate--homocysteine methyltransferase